MRTGRASRAASMNADGDERSRSPSGFEAIVASMEAEYCDEHHLLVVKAESRSRFWVGPAQGKHRGSGRRILVNMNDGLAVSVLDLVGMRGGRSEVRRGGQTWR